MKNQPGFTRLIQATLEHRSGVVVEKMVGPVNRAVHQYRIWPNQRLLPHVWWIFEVSDFEIMSNQREEQFMDFLEKKLADFIKELQKIGMEKWNSNSNA